MAPHHRNSSGSTKSVSPSLGSSVRADYSTSTPHLSRHLPPRGSQAEMLASPHSPLTPVSRGMDSPTIGGGLTSPIPGQHDHNANGLGVNHAGPPLGETQLLHQLTSADGHMVRPEIHARVDKGFFLSDRDWTCYRRNYFSVICSYSLMPTTHSLPLYLRRSATSQPEHILAFAMCISAVVDAPGGKTVELVQHTPKRDKGPQHRPAKIKLSPQPAGGMAFAATSSSPVIQQQHGEHEYTFPQQTSQQQQHIAVFDRIQFKSATANNGKRRAAQQYYHLIVELYADVGSASGSTPGQNNPDAGWVKIAYRISAPMVVRGRSPGHYADERRASTSSPGGGNPGGNNPTGPHPSPRTSSGPGFMGQDGLQSGQGGSNQSMGMHNMHHNSPPTSSMHNPGSNASASPSSSHMEPLIDPSLDEAQTPLDNYPYSYVPTTLYEPAHLPPQSVADSGYDSSSYGDRKSEHSLDTSCSQYEADMTAYIPTTMASASGESYRKAHHIKEEPFSGLSSLAVPWLGSGAMVGREQRFNQNALYPKCGRLETAESSRGLFPDISPL
jgi:meiosis-specific transcription factor NDT80